MSGGRFEYKQYGIDYIANQIEHYVRKNGRKKTNHDLMEEGWRDPDCYKKYPKEVIDEFKKGIEILRKASIYAQRIDCLLSGDDSEESFLKRLKEEIAESEKLSGIFGRVKKRNFLKRKDK